MKRFVILLIACLALLACASGQGCDKKTISAERKVMEPMKTYYIGRFSIDIPATMKMTGRSGKLRRVEIEEIAWPTGKMPEQARAAEWEKFMADVNKLEPPEGKDKAVIRTYDFPEIGKWARGVFYYNKSVNNEFAPWAVLLDVGHGGVWLKSVRTEIEDENSTNRVQNNITNIAKSYQPLDTKNLKAQTPDNRFFLELGAINLPYLVHEESRARFEGHPLEFSINIEMWMDFRKDMETKGLIENTRAMLAASLLQPGFSMSKIRLQEHEAAGIPGEEALIEIKEGKRKELMFKWEYNGKDNSGEYPVISIEMQSPSADKLEEKLRIWDAVIDSMKPLFERKK
jgi:hypothetical protein